MVIKRVLIVSAIVVVAAPFISFAYTAFLEAQRADYGWDPSINAPAYTMSHPRVVVDEAHGNASTAGLASRYWAFARLLRADGYKVRRGTAPFTVGSLDSAAVLVIANASSASKPQYFGINITMPGSDDQDRGRPAFSESEIETIHAWVERGGSLLLIADHAPFGAAASGLADAFDVKMHKGFVEVPNEVSDPLLFSKENGRLGDHPILLGSDPQEAISRVMTFTGQSLDGPAEASVLLRLPANAIEYVPTERINEFDSTQAGGAQGLAFSYGKGRVVVLGEAAMLTAQVSERKPFGMNTPGNDNAQFALNIMHWLSRAL